MAILSAHPARLGTEGWQRACFGPAEGLLVNASLFPLIKRSHALDATIQPGDRVDGRRVAASEAEAGPEDFNLFDPGHAIVRLGCVSPAQTPVDAGASCAGIAPTGLLTEVGFQRAGPSNGAHSVLFVLDQSGSISGLVQHELGDQEVAASDYQPTPGVSFGDLASDLTNLRISTVKRMLRILDARDRAAVLAFSDHFEPAGLIVPCPEATGDVAQDLETCFRPGDASAPWLASDGLDTLIGNASGRSNLWTAVDTAYTYLREHASDRRTRHIVIVTDGPDTAHAAGVPGTRSAAELIARIQTDQAAHPRDPVRVHFVQFESSGYPGRDADQVTVSCLTGGHYQYINTNSLDETGNTSQFTQALEAATVHVVSALRGHWQIGGAVPGLEAVGANDDLEPALLAIDGELVLTPGVNPYLDEVRTRFGISQGLGADEAPAWDRRVTVYSR